jgi:hypothetical protein
MVMEDDIPAVTLWYRVRISICSRSAQSSTVILLYSRYAHMGEKVCFLRRLSVATRKETER